MSATPLVATLIAPTGAVLSDAQIQSVSQRITASGGTITGIKFLSNRRAADIFFAGDRESILPQSRSVPSPLAGRVREGGGEAAYSLPVTISELPDGNPPSLTLPAKGEGTIPLYRQLGLAYPDPYNKFDILIQPTANRRKKILIADMESTVIEQEMLDELANEIGAGEQVAAITRRAMNGELDFVDALKTRANLLKGHPESLLRTCATRMTLMPGARELVAAMQREGGRCWLVSGGFSCFVEQIAAQLGFDRYFANELIIENQIITGAVRSPVLDKNSKKTLLEQACAAYGCAIAQTLAVGDGANDVPMLRACNAGGGLGVAFRAKPAVRDVISNQINRGDLSALIYAQGLIPAA